MNALLMQAGDVSTNTAAYSSSLVLVYVLGFIAAASLGSIAWYNSKRPKGWEGKERPPVVPEVDKSDFIANE